MEVGKFRAPNEKDNSKNFRLLCEKHIKLFNKSWDYFDGMSQKEIETFLKSDKESGLIKLYKRVRINACADLILGNILLLC